MNIPPLATAADLATLGPLRLVYVPTGNEQPDGMIRVPINDWIERASETQSGLDDLACWQREINALGVGPDAVSVVLDDGRMTEAARVWFILQYFGLPVVVLNGGLAALDWTPKQAPRRTEPLTLRPGSGKVGLKDRLSLRAELEQIQVFDARSAAEFRGEDLKGNARGGHLPGAGICPVPHICLMTPCWMARTCAQWPNSPRCSTSQGLTAPVPSSATATAAVALHWPPSPQCSQGATMFTSTT